MNKTMKAFIYKLLVISLLLPTHALATTSGSKYIADPIDGSECRVKVVKSYGSYIYQKRSKYDQVFFPYTSRGGVWHCPKTGFTTLYKDTTITPSEKQAIKKYLDTNYANKKPGYRPSKLQLLEDIYALRDKPAYFENKLLRVLANHHELTKANEYRKLAYDQIVLSLSGDLPTRQQMQYLYLAANYARQFGDVQDSDTYIDRLNTVIDSIKEKREVRYARMLKELVKDTVRITKGGSFVPPPALRR